jgi:cobaltochelatase CobN
VHLLSTRPGGYAAEEGVVDLGQSPGDLVILSTADTDLALLARACDELSARAPRIRLASLLDLRSHASVDRYVDAVLRHARLVVVSAHGGARYFRYGMEQLAAVAEPGKHDLAIVPGEDVFDPELAALSTVDGAALHRIWRYLREGGRENARALVGFLLSRYFDVPLDAPPPRALPQTLIYHPTRELRDFAAWQRQRRTERPCAGLIFYRAHLLSGNLTAFDALFECLDERGIEPLAIATASLRDAACRDTVTRWLTAAGARGALDTTAFAAAGFGAPAGAVRPLIDGVVLQVIASGGSALEWREGTFGLAPRDLAMHVVIPEVDGRIITRAVSFKERTYRSPRVETDVVRYAPDRERTAFVAELARRWIALGEAPREARRIALVLANYPNRDGRLGNGVGLDTPESVLVILRALAGAGYDVRDVPPDASSLMRKLCEQVTNDADAAGMRPCHQSVALEEYEAWLARLPDGARAQILKRWGAPAADPMCRAGRLMISGLPLGNVFVGIQPARGYHIDPAASYHDPDLVPPHGYLAFYLWLREGLGAHAVVHVGKHGNLEWLPGKSVALGPECWPDVAFGPMPHLYPFIVNDPGEGTQAKRRAQAVIVDHLVPPLTRAETYGPLRDLELRLDEYYHAASLDPPRARLLREEIHATARGAMLLRELPPDTAADDDALLRSLDTYLCELKESQIRDGLHVFGVSPQGTLRRETLATFARAPLGPGPLGGTPSDSMPREACTAERATMREGDSVLRALARALLGDDDFDPLTADPAAPWRGARPPLLAKLTADAWRTAGDTRERLELLVRAILAGDVAPPPSCTALVLRLSVEAGAALDACGPREIAGLLAGLDARFVEPGPSGAPSRGRLDVLPTGRNFYSVDVRTVPTRAAWRLARRAAARVVERHLQEHGEPLRCIALSIWATSTMRTGGDDIAEALALLGVRPVWEPATGRVIDTEILSLAELGRPRVDVVLRISGMFRDAFPDLVRVFDAAVRAVSELDESPEENPLRGSVTRDRAAAVSRGVSHEDASRMATYRVFGSKPGAYGAGLQGLIDQRVWHDRGDLADAYLSWSGYAYGADARGFAARDLFEARLRGVEAVLHNQDNREHDILDSDDYYQFQGGMAAAVERARGRPAALYHGDHANIDAPRVRLLREELARVIRSRVVNPKWLAGVRRHGYKGAAEMAATLDYLFGYDAATDLVEDYQYALVADAYLLDDVQRAFVAEHNPAALHEMAERMIEAMQRGMWREPGAHRDAIEALLLDAEERA